MPSPHSEQSQNGGLQLLRRAACPSQALNAVYQILVTCSSGEEGQQGAIVCFAFFVDANCQSQLYTASWLPDKIEDDAWGVWSAGP